MERERAAGGEREGVGIADPGETVRLNLRRLRVQQGLSLSELARASGVSRAMLSQIERSKSIPTINVLSRLAEALGTTCDVLVSSEIMAPVVLREHDTRLSTSGYSGLSVRTLSPANGARGVTLSELRLGAGSVERMPARLSGDVGNLVVAAGAIELEVGATRHTLAVGDSVVFSVALPHTYRNSGDQEALLYLVVVGSQRP